MELLTLSAALYLVAWAGYTIYKGYETNSVSAFNWVAVFAAVILLFF